MAHPQPEKETLSVDITPKLADFVVQTTWEDIEPIREIVENGFLDFIGLTAYAAHMIDSSPAFISAVNNMSATGPGSVIGLSRQYQVQYSALLNGTLSHSMDFDDTNSTASLHPGGSAIAASLGQAELEMSHGRRVSVREFYTAVAVGYEVTCRLGRAISDALHRTGWHPTGVAGVFGAAAAAGRLAGFDSTKIQHLFGVVGSMASGSLQCLLTGGWTKRFHPGMAAHNALLGVQFVKAGMVGPLAYIEGRGGLLYAYARLKPDPTIVEDLGTVWETSNTAIKPYPSCRVIHGAIDAAYALRKERPFTEDMAIDITVGGKAYIGVGSSGNSDRVRPTDIVEGQFSLQYQVAFTWIYGRNDWSVYEHLKDERVLGLARRITVHLDDTIREGSLKTVAKVGDKSVTIEDHSVLGEPDNPVGRREVVAKFLPMAEKIYGVQNAQEILTSFFALEKESDLGIFIKSLSKADGIENLADTY